MSYKALKTYTDRKNQAQAKKPPAAPSSMQKEASNEINVVAGSSQISSAPKPVGPVKKNLIFKSQSRNKALQPLISSTPIETKKAKNAPKKIDPFGFGK